MAETARAKAAKTPTVAVQDAVVAANATVEVAAAATKVIVATMWS